MLTIPRDKKITLQLQETEFRFVEVIRVTAPANNSTIHAFDVYVTLTQRQR